MLASRDGAQESIEELSRPEFVSHAILTLGVTYSLLSPCIAGVYQCLWSLPVDCQ